VAGACQWTAGNACQCTLCVGNKCDCSVNGKCLSCGDSCGGGTFHGSNTCSGVPRFDEHSTATGLTLQQAAPGAKIYNGVTGNNCYILSGISGDPGTRSNGTRANAEPRLNHIAVVGRPPQRGRECHWADPGEKYGNTTLQAIKANALLSTESNSIQRGFGLLQEPSELWRSHRRAATSMAQSWALPSTVTKGCSPYRWSASVIA
jgi:hypothetical protein